MSFVLTDDQQKALAAIVGFLSHPTHKFFVLEGYAGTGKSTLVNEFLHQLPTLLTSMQIVLQRKLDWEVHLTATTNKAAEALSQITQKPVSTIQSFLGLVVATDYKKGTTSLIQKTKGDFKENQIILIDEASYIDDDLKEWIHQLTAPSCKIIFIGDPAQLTPIKKFQAPVFQANYPKAQLNQVVRQVEGNPIIALATAFRHTVNTGEFFQFHPDNHHIIHVPRSDFDKLVVQSADTNRGVSNGSKLLAWTNKRVIQYNQLITNELQGREHLQPGDYAICNKYVSYSYKTKNCNIKTDEEVLITDMKPDTLYNVPGWWVVMNGVHEAFMAESRTDRQNILKHYRTLGDWTRVQDIESNWIDLRAAHACTVNKSQGSTYDRVFIDLDDIAKCNSGNLIARMMYVAVSRARHQVFLTGDLI